MLPISRVIFPASLAGADNGKLPDSVLVAVSPTGRLHSLAARAWTAMQHAAAANGVDLKPTSSADTYRSYEQQLSLFNSRYTKTFDPNVNTSLDARTFNGVKYYKRRNVAAAATPATSNHGWGLAVDVANASGAVLAWLLKNAADFGFSWELQSEPWHIRLVCGDTLPARVVEFERNASSNGATPPSASARPALRRGDNGDQVTFMQSQLVTHGQTVTVDGQFGPRTEQSVKAFQKKNGLTVDGIVGPQTWAALEAKP